MAITTTSTQFEIIFAYVYEVSGLAATSGTLLDKDVGTAQSSSNTTLTSGSTAPTTQASEFWVGFAISDNTGGVALAGPASPWVNLSALNDTANPTSAISGYQIRSATGQVNYTATQHTGAAGTALAAALFAQTATNATITGTVVNVTTQPAAGLLYRRPRRCRWHGDRRRHRRERHCPGRLHHHRAGRAGEHAGLGRDGQRDHHRPGAGCRRCQPGRG